MALDTVDFESADDIALADKMKVGRQQIIAELGKRIMVMINYNTDISEFWEWSDTGFKPIDESNEAYKLGVNYIIYGMTH